MSKKIILQKETIDFLEYSKKFVKPILLCVFSLICWAGIFYSFILILAVIVVNPKEALQEIQRDTFVFAKISFGFAFFLFLAIALTYFSLTNLHITTKKNNLKLR